MKTNIPTNTLPTELANPNSLTTTYTTNVMYPKLGPLAVNRYIRVIAGLLRDYSASVSLVEKVREYNKLFKTPVTVFEQPKEWLKEIVEFKPVLQNVDTYSRTFIVELSEFRDAKVDLNILTSYDNFNMTTVLPRTDSPILDNNSSRDMRSSRRKPIVVFNETRKRISNNL